MEENFENLQRKLAYIVKEKEKCVEKINQATEEEYKLWLEKYHVLTDEEWLIREALDYYESKFTLSSDEIELKRPSDSVENIYWIYLKDKSIRIGHIDYQGYHSSMVSGDIGYFIDSRYKGHNYAYKALCLLSSYLHEIGIPDFYISVYHDNIGSIKTIKKYGGMIINQNELLTTYQCETKKLEKALVK